MGWVDRLRALSGDLDVVINAAKAVGEAMGELAFPPLAPVVTEQKHAPTNGAAATNGLAPTNGLVSTEKLAPTDKVARRAMQGRVIGDLPLYLQMQRIGGNLTPAQVSGIFREADAGDITRLVDLANEARQRDCHLHAVLSTRELALQSLRYQVVPYKEQRRKKPKLKDRKIADWVQETLQGVSGDDSDPKFQLADTAGLVSHLAGAVYFGHATAEIVFGKDGRYVVPVGFSCIGQRRFQFSDEGGRLQWADGFADGVDLMSAYPGKFIQYLPRITGDVPAREGLVRPLMWAALFRNWDIRDWLQLAELAWKPWRTGQYQKAATTEDIDILIQTLENMTSSGIAVYPETDKVLIEWPKHSVSSGGGGTHSELAAFMGGEMSKAVLGQTLTTESGTKGARSLGEIHNKVRGDIRDADARSIASVLRRHLITPLVRMNFGSEVAIPGFEFITQDAVDNVSESVSVLNLRQAGLPIPCAWAYDRFGIPAPDVGEEIMGPTSTRAQLFRQDDPVPADDKKTEAPKEDDQTPPDEGAKTEGKEDADAPAA